jgi:hypothetical protein
MHDVTISMNPPPSRRTCAQPLRGRLTVTASDQRRQASASALACSASGAMPSAPAAVRTFPGDVAAAFGNHSVNAFYDPVLNAYFFHVAYDSEPDGVIWVYRLKNA